MPKTLSDNDWNLLIKRIRTQHCLPFLGAGVSLAVGTDPGLPTGGQLANSLAEECNYPGADKWDFFRVCQYFAMVRDPHSLREAIRDRLQQPKVRPTRVHEILASLPFPYVMTTNFDNLMERSFRDAGKHPKIVSYTRLSNIEELGPATEGEPLVYMLHGSIDQLDTLIATEDDVVDFLACLLMSDPPLPSLISRLFEESSLLFIGYGLKDWNVRVMLRALRGIRAKHGKGRPGPSEIASFAIQRRPNDPAAATEWEASVMYWEKRESLRCYDSDALTFLEELKERYEHQ
jgi:hypothetical protein